MDVVEQALQDRGYFYPDHRPDPTDEDYDPEELTDEELQFGAWCPEPAAFEGFVDLGGDRVKRLAPLDLKPSQFTEFAFRMPRQDGPGYANFSFEGRRHMRRPYDTPAKRILLFCARQVEKSTLLGNKSLCYSCLIPDYRTLYVSPSATQTKTFSSDRIKEPIETSQILKSFTTTMLSQNVFEKQFVNRSKITLRYAFLNADRTRGIAADGLLLDEIQDILSDNIPIIEQCTSHAREHLKRFVYAGTPKGLDNTIEHYRSGVTKDGTPMSTQGEWVVPCDRHGGEGGRYWNILTEKNIGKKGLSCEKCGNLIESMHPDSQWAIQAKDGVFESYRIPQLMVPWKSWEDILLDYSRYGRDKFYNEVLGISYDSGLRPLTMQQVRSCCNAEVHMTNDGLRPYRTLRGSQHIFGGLDWGTGEHSYTVFCLGTYVGMRFRIFYIHRFVGEDIDPEVQLQKIITMCARFNVLIIGSDYGGGFSSNFLLTKKFGRQRVQKYQYIARPKRKVEWDNKLLRWKVHRTEVMSDVFNAIKKGALEFPAWNEFREPYATDMLNIFSEYNNTLRMLQYNHHPDKPDDAFHAILYCFLASMIKFPRPDIIAPTREEKHEGPRWGNNYGGPIDQGQPLLDHVVQAGCHDWDKAVWLVQNYLKGRHASVRHEVILSQLPLSLLSQATMLN